ncbi:CorA family divalent cation transporter [Streptomyces sp. TLI_185]|uniref:CorA family divalent cation transporter n=1 Tax=Streptomyces sp. TLI_185 TaxID=2485151 RepID=UPI000F9B1F3E|nr:CorA family divalent cation transporter [Streptomyces sp. TLI_185]RPF38322.1 magnesium transporter [Streptomyces sp. TLI_185]
MRGHLERLGILKPDEFAWIRLSEPGQGAQQRLGQYLKLHPLAIEDAVHAHQRPKQERYGDVRLAQQPDMARLGPVSVLHAVTDVITAPTHHRAYTRAAAQIRTDLTDLQRCVFSPAHEDLTEQIHSLKREVVEFRDAIQPLVPSCSPSPRHGTTGRRRSCRTSGTSPTTSPAPTPRSAPWTICSAILDAHLAEVGTWQNDDRRRISAWAAIFAIPTMTAGIYGMNFARMPELDWRYGYLCALAVMALEAGTAVPGLSPQRLVVTANDPRVDPY